MSSDILCHHFVLRGNFGIIQTFFFFNTTSNSLSIMFLHRLRKLKRDGNFSCKPKHSCEFSLKSKPSKKLEHCFKILLLPALLPVLWLPFGIYISNSLLRRE